MKTTITSILLFAIANIGYSQTVDSVKIQKEPDVTIAIFNENIERISLTEYFDSLTYYAKQIHKYSDDLIKEIMNVYEVNHNYLMLYYPNTPMVTIIPYSIQSGNGENQLIPEIYNSLSTINYFSKRIVDSRKIKRAKKLNKNLIIENAKLEKLNNELNQTNTAKL
jgi:hypothetical protein